MFTINFLCDIINDEVLEVEVLIIETYKNGESYSMYYDNIIVHLEKPKTIKIDRELIQSFYNWVDIDDYISTVKILAGNLED